MTRPEWRVQGTKPLMYSHINSHNITNYKSFIHHEMVAQKIETDGVQ